MPVSLSLSLPCYPALPPYPFSSPTVCDPLNFVCCLWRKKMRLSILATCKNFISCAGDVAVQCIDPHSLTHIHSERHTYIRHMPYHSWATTPLPHCPPSPLHHWLVAVFAKRLFALRLPVLFRIRFTDNCITALNISLFVATAPPLPPTPLSTFLSCWLHLCGLQLRPQFRIRFKAHSLRACFQLTVANNTL